MVSPALNTMIYSSNVLLAHCNKEQTGTLRGRVDRDSDFAMQSYVTIGCFFEGLKFRMPRLLFFYRALICSYKHRHFLLCITIGILLKSCT